ncbi:hypothetical protein K502DRAFT_344389 [Neoconidiobolus thromboides FSU 785]|nr:hypothetical protein K502DRAFT_344389 [Neoconidiobolus thromboides FSU 785]
MDYIGYIETVYDAFILAEAALQGQVKLLQNRPSFNKNSIFSGKTVLFEKQSGMLRWTDGKSWTPSKLKNGFFIYTEVDKVNIKKIHSLLNTTQTTKIVKKVINVVNANLKEICIVNYYFEDDVSNLIKPSNYYFRDSELILNNIKDYSYIKSYRVNSKSYRKLYKLKNKDESVEVEFNHNIPNLASGTNTSTPPEGAVTHFNHPLNLIEYESSVNCNPDNSAFNNPCGLTEYQNGVNTNLNINPFDQPLPSLTSLFDYPTNASSNVYF